MNHWDGASWVILPHSYGVAMPGEIVRVDLKVPFDEKEQAKLVGARWDPARKVWYVVNADDLHPFIRWMPGVSYQIFAPGQCTGKPPMAAPRRSKPQRSPSLPAKTERTAFSLPDCGCLHVAPWAHCEHSITNITSR